MPYLFYLLFWVGFLQFYLFWFMVCFFCGEFGYFLWQVGKDVVGNVVPD